MKKPIINFEHDENQNHESQASWLWHYGNVIHNDITYTFTLLEMSDGASGTSTFELTFCDDTPIGLDLEVLKDEIINQIDEPVEVIQSTMDRKMSDDYKSCLVKRGLSEAEGEQFLALMSKVQPTEEDQTAYDYECEQGLPFEGGMGFTEALTAMKLCFI